MSIVYYAVSLHSTPAQLCSQKKKKQRRNTGVLAEAFWLKEAEFQVAVASLWKDETETAVG